MDIPLIHKISLNNISIAYQTLPPCAPFQRLFLAVHKHDGPMKTLCTIIIFSPYMSLPMLFIHL